MVGENHQKPKKTQVFFFVFCIPIAKRTQGKKTSFEARPKSLFKALFFFGFVFALVL
jgi:hypothetical protein